MNRVQQAVRVAVQGLVEKKAPNPAYMPPEPPKGLSPLEVHGYYMSMSDYHDRQSSKHARIRGLKKLWSDDRNYHDDRHNFHKALRDGYAQKALAIDLHAQEQQQKSGFGMNESQEKCVSCGAPATNYHKETGQSSCDNCRDSVEQDIQNLPKQRMKVAGGKGYRTGYYGGPMEGRSWFDVTGDIADDKPAEKPALTGNKRGNAFLRTSKVPSCWGCGHDYLSRWEPGDLNKNWLNQETGERMKNHICPDCHGEAAVTEADLGSAMAGWFGKGGPRKVQHPFQGGVKHTRVTVAHQPLVWENMLGTVYARNPQGKTEYFDYDYDAAHEFAGVQNAKDLRVVRHNGRTGMDEPRKKQLVLYGIHPKVEAFGGTSPTGLVKPQGAPVLKVLDPKPSAKKVTVNNQAKKATEDLVNGTKTLDQVLRKIF